MDRPVSAHILFIEGRFAAEPTTLVDRHGVARAII
jgi:hypothetical protein